MAKENIVKFLDDVIKRPEMAECVAKFATQEGYPFTAQELLEVSQEGALSEAELNDCAGGVATAAYNWVFWHRFI